MQLNNNYNSANHFLFWDFKTQQFKNPQDCGMDNIPSPMFSSDDSDSTTTSTVTSLPTSVESSPLFSEQKPPETLAENINSFILSGFLQLEEPPLDDCPANSTTITSTFQQPTEQLDTINSGAQNSTKRKKHYDENYREKNRLHAKEMRASKKAKMQNLGQENQKLQQLVKTMKLEVEEAHKTAQKEKLISLSCLQVAEDIRKRAASEKQFLTNRIKQLELELENTALKQSFYR